MSSEHRNADVVLEICINNHVDTDEGIEVKYNTFVCQFDTSPRRMAGQSHLDC